MDVSPIIVQPTGHRANGDACSKRADPFSFLSVFKNERRINHGITLRRVLQIRMLPKHPRDKLQASAQPY